MKCSLHITAFCNHTTDWNVLTQHFRFYQAAFIDEPPHNFAPKSFLASGNHFSASTSLGIYFWRCCIWKIQWNIFLCVCMWVYQYNDLQLREFSQHSIASLFMPSIPTWQEIVALQTWAVFRAFPINCNKNNCGFSSCFCCIWFVFYCL